VPSADGRRRQRSGAGKETKNAALAEMRKVQAEVVAGAYVEPKRLSLAAYLDDWLGRVRAQIREHVHRLRQGR
jgi:hypothetical protein